MSKPPSHGDLEARIGERVKSRYLLRALIGVGGQGAVYRALDTRDGDEVAVKVLHDAVDRDPVARQRLSREAQALMALTGTAAVRVLDQGFTFDGKFCLITELLVGEDLEETFARMKAHSMAFRVVDMPTLFEPIASTLEKAHGLDIIHRDLKPENVFIAQVAGGISVRLMDFGFAKFTRMPKLTTDGFVAGSPSYIAPEIWLDKPVTESADVYALGAMMFRTLAGTAPFTGASLVEIYRAATSAERPSLHALRPDLSPDVDRWVSLALAIDPNERFRTPRASYRALCSALGLPT